jgi:hypothetical protein
MRRISALHFRDSTFAIVHAALHATRLLQMLINPVPNRILPN